MAQNTNADDGRTDTKRFTDDVSGDELIEGDRISKDLVARVQGQYGDRVRPSHPEADEVPTTQLVALTEIRRHDDVHSAILADPETETFVRASRHSSSQAWSQKEEDWTVREVGTRIVVENAVVEDWGGDEPADDVAFIQGWVEILFDEALAGEELDDRRSLSGTSLSLHDEFEGHKAAATISIESEA